MKYLISAVLLITGACSADEAPQMGGGRASDAEPLATETRSVPDSAAYMFDQPTLSLVLSEELRETSGLTILPNGHIGTVQDEDGIVFALNRETGTVEARLPFGDGGDYEGIEWVGDRGFVLRSNGTLIELSGGLDDVRQARTHETSLKGKNDTEGLGYDSANGRLVIACKEDPGSGLDNDRRAIYAFDLASGELSAEPVYVIERKDVERELSGDGNFKPSAVAVHPSTGEIYVLSSTALALAVLDVGGGLRAVHELPESLFEQPEGLAFLPDGTLYISSEGDKGPPMLYQFAPGR